MSLKDVKAGLNGHIFLPPKLTLPNQVPLQGGRNLDGSFFIRLGNQQAKLTPDEWFQMGCAMLRSVGVELSFANKPPPGLTPP